MTAALTASAAIDPVLRRLPLAIWRALPSLAVSGLTSLVAVVAVAWGLGPGNPWLFVCVGVVAAPTVMWAIESLQGDMFLPSSEGAPYRTRLMVAEVLVGLPAGLATWSAFTAGVAAASQMVFFQILAVALSIATVVGAAIAVVGLPIALRRPEIRLRTVMQVSLSAVVRRPVAPIAALLAATAVVWLGITWFAGLLIFAVPTLVIFTVAAAWSTATPSGVALPELIPLRDRKSTIKGEK